MKTKTCWFKNSRKKNDCHNKLKSIDKKINKKNSIIYENTF